MAVMDLVGLWWKVLYQLRARLYRPKDEQLLPTQPAAVALSGTATTDH
jgi:hypothetical protein